MGKKGNPFWNFIKKLILVVILLLWVIFPDFIPGFLDDIIALIAGVAVIFSMVGDIFKALKM